MLAMDMPDLSPQYAQVMIVQSGEARKGTAKPDRTLGVCQVIENRRLRSGKPKISAVNSVSPIDWVEIYFRTQEHRQIEGPSTVTVLESSTHGELRDEGTLVLNSGVLVETGRREYAYIPNLDYFGKDGAVMLVEIAGMKIKILYTFHVVKGFVENYPALCPPSGVRKISLNHTSEPRSPRLISHDVVLGAKPTATSQLSSPLSKNSA